MAHICPTYNQEDKDPSISFSPLNCDQYLSSYITVQKYQNFILQTL